jgi:copper transport protein
MRLSLRRLVIALSAVLAVLVIAPAPAQAHAFLQNSSPADGQVLASAPSQLRLQFSEAIVLEVTRIEIVGTDGALSTATKLRLAGKTEDTEDPVELVADLPSLPHGAFRVSWQTLSADDLHRTSGVFVFGIGQQVAAAGTSEPLPRGEEAALRWALFLALAGSFGGALAARLFRRRGYLLDAAAACERICAVGSVGALLLSAALLFDQDRATGIGLRQLLGSPYGHRWLIRGAGLVLLIAAAVIAQRRPTSWTRGGLTGSGAVVVGAGSAVLGHAGAQPFGVSRVVADGAHLVAAATWAGAVLVLACVGYRQLRAGGIAAAATRSTLRGFAAPAAGCVAVLVVTGIYLSSTVVGSVDALLLTFYGRSLLVKVALFAGMSLVGLANHRRVRCAGGSVSSTLRIEAGLAALVLGATALLTSSQPANEQELVRAPATVPILDGSVADLQQTLAIRPNRPGRNVVLVEVFDTRRPAPAPVSSVRITVTGADGRVSGPVNAMRLADGKWSASTDLAVAGRASVRVSVQRPGLAQAVHRYSWTVGGGQRVRPATVSNAPIRGWLRAASITAAVLLGGLCLVLAARARRRAGRHAEPGADATAGLAQPALRTGAD